MPYSHLFLKDKILCSCNNVTVGDAVEFLKENNIKNVHEWIDSDIMPLGDKCEACLEEGTENDGLTLAAVLSQFKQGNL